jgi:hypothetical protein
VVVKVKAFLGHPSFIKEHNDPNSNLVETVTDEESTIHKNKQTKWSHYIHVKILARQDYCDITNRYFGGSVDSGELRWKQASNTVCKVEKDVTLTDDPLMIQTSKGEAFVQIHV